MSETQLPNPPKVTKSENVAAAHQEPTPLAPTRALAEEEPPKAHHASSNQGSTTSRLLASFMSQAEEDQMFDGERLEADAELNHWKRYVDTFYSTFGRKPVLYDLFCGEGTFARGAVEAGCEVHGFDWMPQPRTYGMAPRPRMGQGRFERQRIDAMHYHQQDLEEDMFWERLSAVGCAIGCPKPDVIHASPLCTPHTTLQHLGSKGDLQPKDESQIPAVMERLLQYQ